MNRIQRLTFLIAAILLHSTQSVAAQQSIERYAIDLKEASRLISNEDSVRAVLDAAPRDSVQAAVHSAIHVLRLTELGAAPDEWQETLAGQFERIAALTGEPSWQHFGKSEIIRANIAMPRKFILFASLKAGAEAREQRTNLLKGLSVNPSFEPALLELAALADRMHDSDLIGEALAAIDHAKSDDPRVAAAAIELELARDSVSAANRRAQEVPTAVRSSPEVLYATAIAVLHSGDVERGGRLYREAVGSNSRAVLRYVRLDAGPLRKGGERLDSDKDVVAFWDTHASMVGLTFNEKLAQHYQRLHTARRAFQRRSKSNVPDSKAIIMREELDESGLDIRGIIYLRRGEPKLVIRSRGPSSDSESWVYETLGYTEVLHFVRSSLSPDWGLASGFMCDDDYSMARGNYDAYAARALSACRSGSPQLKQALVREAQAEAVEMSRLEAPDKNTRELPFFFTVQNLKTAESHKPETLIVAGVPLDRLTADSTADGFRYRFNMTVTLVHWFGTAREQKDTAISVTTKARPGKNDLVRVIIEMPAFAGSGVRYLVRARDLNAPGTARSYSGTAEVSGYTSGVLAMSDLVLARPAGTGGGWRRGSHMLDVLPVQQFERGELGVYFELYNVEPDTDYRMSVRVVQESGKLLRKKDAVQVGFTEHTDAARTERLQVFKVVNLQLPRGKYRLQVTVDGGRGSSVMKERLFEIP